MMIVCKEQLLRVAVADDSAIFRSVLRRLLASLPDIQLVAEATDGQEALQVVEAMLPDILLLDIQMPKMNGLEVLHHLQALEAKVQVVVLSAHEYGYQEQVLASGATAFVHKGDIPRLINTLSRLANG